MSSPSNNSGGMEVPPWLTEKRLQQALGDKVRLWRGDWGRWKPHGHEDPAPIVWMTVHLED